MEHFRERQSFLSGACSNAIDSKDFLNGKYQKKNDNQEVSPKAKNSRLALTISIQEIPIIASLSKKNPPPQNI